MFGPTTSLLDDNAVRLLPLADIRDTLHVAIDQADIAMAICDMDFVPIFLNRAARRMAGIAPGASMSTIAFDRLLGSRSLDAAAIMADIRYTGIWRGDIMASVDDAIGDQAMAMVIARFDGENGQGILVTATPRNPAIPRATASDLISASTGLTRREREVMLGLVDGSTNKSIALALGISPRTVEFHRARLMQRFGAKSLIDLIRLVTVGTG
ncbi:DNA-binding CsgD family transcriptional regulator [Sphingomonas sp. UYAg733]